MEARAPLVDAHAHLHQYGAGLEAALDEVRTLRIVTMAVAMDVPSYRETETVARKEPLVIPAFGIHPWNAPAHADRLDEIGEIARMAPVVGEIGLDYHFVKEPDRHVAQRAVFERLVAVASDTGKLVNVHTKGAEADVARILRSRPPPAIVIHWYSGPDEPLEALLDLGASFTVGVEVHTSPLIRKIARRIPADRLLTETDNPGGWQWLRGELGLPAVLPRVLAELAEIRGVPVPELRAGIARNFRSLLAAGSVEAPEGVFEPAEPGKRP